MPIVCAGSPGGSQSDPKKDCLKKGWKWTRKGCVDPNGRCPKGYIGSPPNCLKLPPPRCPKGYVGTPPNCRKLPHKPCPKGYIGQPPNCTKMTFNPPNRQAEGREEAVQETEGPEEELGGAATRPLLCRG